MFNYNIDKYLLFLIILSVATCNVCKRMMELVPYFVSAGRRKRITNYELNELRTDFQFL